MSEAPSDRHPRQTTAVVAANGGEHHERPSWRGLTPVSLVVALAVAYLLWQVQDMLILLMFAILFATLIEWPVELLQRQHIPRPISILLIYIAIIAGLTLFFVGVAPVIRDQVALFRDQVPEQVQALRTAWAASGNPLLSGLGQELLSRAVEIVQRPQSEIQVPEGAPSVVLGVAASFGGGVIGLLTTLVIAFYYLLEKKWLRQIILEQVKPPNRPRVSQIIESVEAKVGGWMRGQLLLMLTIGLCAAIGYAVLGIRFWPILGIWAGLTELIPIVGPWLGGIPAVIIALTQGWDKALLVVIVIVLLQSLENYILVPRIMRGAVGLSPMTVFLAILAGTQFLGIMGAVLAIPVAAAIQVILTDYFRSRREEYLAEMGAEPTGWQWMRGQRMAVAGPEPTAMAPPRSRPLMRRRPWAPGRGTPPDDPDS